MRKTLSASVLLALFAVSITGCGNSLPRSPVEPAVATASALATSATVSGSVVGGGSGAASSATGTPLAGVLVTATGGMSSATVDAAGRFLLTGVPAGDVELRFTGPGVDARVTVGTAAAGATIEVHVTVQGNTAGLDDSEISHNGQREIEGRVEAVPPTTAAGQFVVAGKTIVTTSTTAFKLNDKTGSFADLIAGARVHVKGQTSGAAIVAVEVSIQNTQVDVPAELNGVVSSLTGTASAFTFDIGSRHISGDSATAFNDHRTFGDLRNGAQVEVKGSQRNNVVIASRIEIAGDGGENGREVELTGSVSSKGGSCPALTFSVSGTRTTTSSSTRFDIACTSIANGVKVQVKGTRAPDGSVAATRVKKED